MTAAAAPTNPIDLKAELERGYAALGSGALDEAGGVAEGLIASLPKTADGWRLRARVELLRGDLAAARATLAAGIVAADEPLALLADQAEVAIKAEDGPAALAASLEARRLGGELVRWVLLTAKARWSAGERETALADFELAANHAPDVAEVQVAYARALFGLGRSAEGVAVLESAVARRPGGIASALLALATLDPSDPTRKLPAVDAALTLTPREPTLNILQAMLRALAGDASAATAAQAAAADDAHLRARWQMFEHLRAHGCAAYCGQPEQVHTIARAAASGVELAFGPKPALDALPATVGFVRIECRDAADASRVFDALGDRLRAGTVLLFPAFLGFPGADRADFAAWQQLVAARAVRCSYLAGALFGSEVAILIDAIEPVGAK